MPLESFVSAFVTLLVTVDPIGIVPIFLVLTRGADEASRNRISRHASLIAFAIISFFALLGASLLEALGIGMPALRISGGILLFWIAFQMVFENRTERKQYSAEAAREEHPAYIAAFPLGIPLIAGPGAITAVILLSGQTDGSMASKLLLLAIIAAVCALCFLCFATAGKLAHLLGATGTAVFSRVLGVLLSALAVQFVVDGLKAILRS